MTGSSAIQSVRTDGEMSGCGALITSTDARSVAYVFPGVSQRPSGSQGRLRRLMTFLRVFLWVNKYQRAELSITHYYHDCFLCLNYKQILDYEVWRINLGQAFRGGGHARETVI